eukprot:gene4505-4758_t
MALLQQPPEAACGAGAAVLSVAVLTDGVALGLGRVVDTAADAGAASYCEAVPSCLIAQLPLLVLPANAHVELQGLFDAATARELDEGDAYRELLPLLQDWAALMLWSYSTNDDGSCPTATDSSLWNAGSARQMQVEADAVDAQGTHSSFGLARNGAAHAVSKGGGDGLQHQQQLLIYLHEELVASVSSFLDAYELTECSKLLTLQQWQQQHAIVGQGYAVATHSPSSLSSATPAPVNAEDTDQNATCDDVAELLAEQLPGEAADLLPYALTSTLLAPGAASPGAAYAVTSNLPCDATE